MPLRGIRGATVTPDNTKESILKETEELLGHMLRLNKIEPENIATIFFSVTTDLTAEFPAVAARNMGFIDTPLMCFTEIPVEGSLQKCIRILIQTNDERPQNQFQHIYLNEAIQLRPDSQKTAS